MNGMITCVRCNISSNFAMYGGVLYSQNEGLASFINSTFTNNTALQGSIVYSINSMSKILVSGGNI